MSTLTEREVTASIANLPRVNLLPPEIEEQRRFKRVQAGLGVAVLAAVGGVGAILLVTNGQVSSAQGEVDAQTARSATLQSQAAKYAEVPAVYAQVDVARTQLSTAMGQEVRWSRFLNDLSLATPGKVWLTGMTVTQTTDAAPALASALAGGQAYGTPNIGTVTFDGKGSTHNDVAAWLQALGNEEGLADPYFTQSTEQKIGSEDSVSFTSQAVITKDLLSDRFSAKAGS